VALADDLDRLLHGLPGARVIVFADLSSKMILAHAMRDIIPQEQLDEISRQAAASFAEPLCEPGLGKVNEAIFFGIGGIKLFIRSQIDESDALCLIGDHSTNAALAAAQLRELMNRVEAAS
jgi:hypothetical protein